MSSKTVDERVVEMRFDNKQFEQGVQSTTSLLDKFKHALKLDGATKGLQEVETQANKTTMRGLSGAIETVHAKFSALDVFAVTALQRMSNAAIDTGEKLVDMFAIKPVRSGFEEYETQMNAIQTILANTQSKGSTLEDVNGALDELNKYADQTIYNFTEMTRNIGTFTAAGVGLKESTSAIKGIANLAAVSGSSAQQASTAMYQLSQALAAGTVQLQDWNSVVNAGMGGEIFQNALMRTAEHMGTNMDAIMKKYGTFRESLTKGQWLTTEVLTETLTQLSGAYTEADLIEQGYSKKQAKDIAQLGQTAVDAATKVKTFSQLIDTLEEAAQSGWTQTWQTIVGDFDQAKELFTEISDSVGGIIEKMSNSRNELIGGAFDSSWSQLSSKVKAAGVDIDTFKNSLIETATAHGVNVKKMIKEEGSFEASLKRGWLSKGVILETFKKITGSGKEVSKTAKQITKDTKELQKVVNQVINGNFGNGAARVKALTKAGYDYKTVQGLVNQQIRQGKIDWTKMSDSQLKNTGYTKKQIKELRKLQKEAEATGTPLSELIEKMERPSGRDLFIDTFRNACVGAYKAITTIKKAWRDLFPKTTSEQLYNVIESLHKFSTYLVMDDIACDKLYRTMKGLFAIVKMVTTFTGGALRIGLKIIGQLLGSVNLDILDVTAAIGDAAVTFSDFITKNNFVIKGLERLVSWLIKGSKQAISFVKQFNGVNKFASGVKNLVLDLVKYFKNLDGITFKNIPNAVTSLKELIVYHFNEIKSNLWSFTDIVNAVDEFVSARIENIKSYASDIKDGLWVLANVAGEFLEQSVTGRILISITKMVTTLGEGLMNMLKNIISKASIGQILAVGAGGALIVFMKKLITVADKVVSPLGSFSDLLDTVGDAIDRFGKAKAFKAKTEGIRNIAISIAILAGSLWLLAQVPNDKLVAAGVALGGVAAGLFILAAAMTVLSKIGGDTKGGFGMALMAVSILILVKAMKNLDGIDPATYGDKLKVIGVLAMGLMAMSIILSKAAPEMSKGAVLLFVMAKALDIMVGTLNKIGDLDPSKIKTSLAVMMLAIRSLGVMANACSKMSFSGGMGMLAMVVAIRLYINVLNAIADIDGAKMILSIGKFILVLGSFVLLMKAMNKASKHAAKAGIGMVGIALAMILMTHAIKSLGEADPAVISAGLEAVKGMLLVFGAVIAMSKFAGKNSIKAGIMLLAMAGTLTILAFVAMLMAKLDPVGIERAMGALEGMTICFGIVIGMTKLMDKASKNGVKMLTRISITIALLAIAVAGLSMIEPDRLQGAVVAMDSMMLIFALLIKVSSNAKKSTGAVLIMLGTVIVLSGVLAALSQLPIESTMGTAQALSEMIVALSVAALLISKIPVSSALTGIAGFAIVIAGLAAIIAALGGLSKIDGFEELMKAGGGILGIIGQALGDFVGGILGGMLSGVTDSFPKIGENISKFSENIKPFIQNMKSIDEKTTAGINSLAKALLAITAAELMDSIAVFIGGSDMDNLADKLSDLGKGVVAFSDEVKGKVDDEAVTAAAAAGEMLAKMAATVPRSGGLFQAIAGEKDLDKFGSQLGVLGEGLAEFSKKVKGKIDEESVTAAAGAGKLLAELNNNIPATNGWAQKVAGEKNLAEWASGLSELAQGLVMFSAKVDQGSIDEKAIKKAAHAGTLLAKLNDAIPASNGWAQRISGEKNLAEWGSGLGLLADGLVNFSDKVKDSVDEKSVTAAVGAGKMLAELNDRIPASEGIIQVFSGNKDLDTFGEHLVSFGESFAKYADEVKHVDGSVLDGSTTAAKSIVELSNNLGTNNSWFSNKKQLSDFGIDLAAFGEAFGVYARNIQNVNPDQLSGVIRETYSLVSMINDLQGINFDGAGRFADALKSLANNSITGFIQEFTSAETSVRICATNMISFFIDALSKKYKSVSDSFATMMTGVMTTIQAKYPAFKDSGTAIAAKTVEGVRSQYYEMYQAAVYMVEGFSNGIDANKYKAEAKAKEMARLAKEGARKELDEHSPSKEFYKIGDFAGVAFVNALDDYGKKSYRAGADMAKYAKTGISNSIQTISDVLNSKIDTSPRITPVVDLSNVRQGAGQIGRLLSSSRTMTLSAGLTGHIQNGNNNDDVIKAINKLRTGLSDLGNTTYQINGITYDDGSNITSAVETLVRAAKIGRRV